MEYVNLGRAGVKVSRTCMGCFSFGDDATWKVGPDQAQQLIKRAIDLGVNSFDTANVYSSGRSEDIRGECLKGYRDDVVVTTKVYFPMGVGPNESGLSRRHIMQQIRASLKRLQMDYVDLYQIHRWDYNTPIQETMRPLDDLVHFGFAYYIGASNIFAWQLLEALYANECLGLENFVSIQNHYNPVYREEEREMIPLCKEEGLAVIPWSPLARGFLTGKYKRGEAPMTKRFESDRYLGERYFKPEDFDVLETVEGLAREKDAMPAQIALAWLLHKGVTSLIVGATKVEHVEEAVGAMEIRLDLEDMTRLEEKYRPHPLSSPELLFT